MQIQENVREGLRSVRNNLLRSILTAAIVAIGITSLVGILTAIDAMQASITSNFSTLGANTFTIKSVEEGRREQNRGRESKAFEPVAYEDAMLFQDKYQYGSLVAVSTFVANWAEAKYGSKTSNPNMLFMGIDSEYLPLKGYDLIEGRNFSPVESQYGSHVAIIGPQVRETLFAENENPIGKDIRVMGSKFRVVGVLESAGSMGGDSGTDRAIFIPLIAAREFATQGDLRYSIDVEIENPGQLDAAMGEATGLMRIVRRDRLGQPDSFELERNKTAAESLAEIEGYLKIGGFVIGIITLLGASIGLMNIMMVSVTERTREIGVRKALGATPLKIRQQFIIEAIVICLIGGVAGVLLGLTIGNLVSGLVGESVFIIPWLWIIMGFTLCILVGLFSGYYPAYKASKLDPVESLRFE